MRHQYLPLKCIKNGFSLVENIVSATIFIALSLSVISSFMAYIKMSEESNRLQVSQILVSDVCDLISRNEFPSFSTTVEYKPTQIPGNSQISFLKKYDDKLLTVINKSAYSVGSGVLAVNMKLYKVYVYEKLANNQKKLLFQNNVIAK